ncbi:hypothetical protein HYFRA_00011376 [Hymenoscyphus fraxineus]|uniref:Uncharacterized protein n=1 Tax=Hymenoscyphus fraxineus TaxID=746836 RepID=A0A9N9L1L1_9HELO|nr:hypothetical protein HYFRA_00011376 [Hymenoscyphus fraxineus]
MAPKIDKLMNRISASDTVTQHPKIEKVVKKITPSSSPNSSNHPTLDKIKDKITPTSQNDYAWSCSNHLEPKYKTLSILDSVFPVCDEPHCSKTMLPPKRGDVWVCTKEKHQGGWQHTRTDEERQKKFIPSCGVCGTSMTKFGKEEFDWEVNGLH